MKKYFEYINKEVERAYAKTKDVKAKGLDPVSEIEIPIARSMAERVEGLISAVAPQIKNSGMVERILELENKYGKLDWRVAFTISKEVAQENFCKFEDKKEAMEVGLRVGLAYLTNGVVASPLEGFTKLVLKKRRDGKEYFCLYFSGPMRSAGTTASCAFVALADYVRHEMGYAEYDPTDLEVKRMVIELMDFHERITNLQYMPSEEEIIFMSEHLPVQIDGDPSEKLEVSNHKDLDRIETNRLRNGVSLVYGEGLTQKAKKFWGFFSKWYKEFDMGHWKFIEEFLRIQTSIKAKEQKEDDKDVKIKPDYTFIKDIVAGRPVLTHPLRTGGFRLRYGRCRTTGLSSMGISPYTMLILDSYIAIGTQLKNERPSKGTVLSSCDTIEGPIVKLKDGSVIFVDSEEKFLRCKDNVEEIVFLGDLLINYGDFLDRGHVLVPCGYNEEWWLREFESAVIKKFNSLNFDKLSEFLEMDKTFLEDLFLDFSKFVNFDDALKISKKLKINLHPKWTYHWKDITKEMFVSLLNWFKNVVVKDDKAILPFSYDVSKDLKEEDPKRALELIGLEHEVVSKEYVVIKKDNAKSFCYIMSNIDSLDMKEKDVLEIINNNLGIGVKDKSGTFIGARMGRPEKAKMRKLTGSPNVLFPVGEEGGRLRSFQAAMEKGKIRSQFPIFYCSKCERETIYPYCEKCLSKTEQKYYCELCGKTLFKECEKHESSKRYKFNELDIENYFKSSLKLLGLKQYPDLIKGVRGTSNVDHTPEDLSKGILRASHNLYVNKDGTIRYDMTEMAITAFKPCEIGTSIEKLKEIGYDKDIYGNDLVENTQTLMLKVQDVILPACRESAEEGADLIFYRVSKFIDDLLKRFYKVDSFYNLEKKEDLVGHLIVGLAPHISAGVVGRIIGFSKTQGFYAHPYFHCAVRRDCDGDEVAAMLLMDALLNFSRKYLPAHRGARQDTPLVLTPILIPSEVDDMVFKMDVVDKYPLELYEAAEQYKYPWEVKIETVNDRLGKAEEYYCYEFTHDTSNLNDGVRCSAYKSIPTMQDKVLGQMRLAEKIRAVDEFDVARLVVDRHFLRDIKGNLRKFSQQQFRCVSCNEKYRRPPLIGNCLKCGGRIIFTVSEGTIIKYLEPSLSLAEKFNLPPYLRQSLDLTKMMIESVFGKDKEKQEGLVKWFE